MSLGLGLSGGGGGLVEGVVSASDIAWGTALGAEGGAKTYKKRAFRKSKTTSV